MQQYTLLPQCATYKLGAYVAGAGRCRIDTREGGRRTIARADHQRINSDLVQVCLSDRCALLAHVSFRFVDFSPSEQVYVLSSQPYIWCVVCAVGSLLEGSILVHCPDAMVTDPTVRIVSLLPSATEMLVASGAAGLMVRTVRHCARGARGLSVARSQPWGLATPPPAVTCQYCSG